MVMVTFRLPRAIDAHRACVVGEFNDWSETANPMERDRDSFLARIPLAPGRPYRFRYLLDGERWENDWAADAYVTNDFGGDDSVIDLTDKATEVPAVPRRHQRRRRTQRTGHRREPKRKRTRVPRRDGRRQPRSRTACPGERVTRPPTTRKEPLVEQKGQDAIGFLEQQHTEVRSRLSTFASGAPDRAETFDALVRLLAVHETAEEMVVYPTIRANVPDGAALADAPLKEERAAKRTLSDLEKLGVDDDRFDNLSAQFARDVNSHAEHEERAIFPQLREHVDSETLDKMRGALVAAEAAAPTHPHPYGPESAVGNLVVGPFVAIADRLRDALRSVTH